MGSSGISGVFLVVCGSLELWDISVDWWMVEEEDGGSCVSVGWLGCSEEERKLLCYGRRSWVLAWFFLVNSVLPPAEGMRKEWF